MKENRIHTQRNSRQPRQPRQPRQLPSIVDSQSAAAKIHDGTANVMVAHRYLDPKSEVGPLVRAASIQANAISNGDLSQLEKMLLLQASATQAMFIELAMLAKDQAALSVRVAMTSLALKCAAQSRQAISVLSEMKQPRAVLFARQANVANGPQQVNNGTGSLVGSSHAENSQSFKNEVLGRSNEQRVDTGQAGSSGRADQVLEALGQGDRPLDF